MMSFLKRHSLHYTNSLKNITSTNVFDQTDLQVYQAAWGPTVATYHWQKLFSNVKYSELGNAPVHPGVLLGQERTIFTAPHRVIMLLFALFLKTCKPFLPQMDAILLDSAAVQTPTQSLKSSNTCWIWPCTIYFYAKGLVGPAPIQCQMTTLLLKSMLSGLSSQRPLDLGNKCQ